MARQIPPPPSGGQGSAPGSSQHPRYAPPPQHQQYAHPQQQPQYAPPQPAPEQERPPGIPQEQWDEYQRQLREYERQLFEYQQAQAQRAQQAQQAQAQQAPTQQAPTREAPPSAYQPPAAPASPPAPSTPVSAPSAPAVSASAPRQADPQSAVQLPPSPATSVSTASTTVPASSAEVGEETETRTRVGSRTRTWILNSSGQRFTLAARNLLGRKPTAGQNDGQAALIVLADPERTLSKTHARIEIDSEGVWITDLGSTNGTSLTFSTEAGLSRQVCEPGEDYEIRPGDTITLGAVEVSIETAD